MVSGKEFLLLLKYICVRQKDSLVCAAPSFSLSFPPLLSFLSLKVELWQLFCNPEASGLRVKSQYTENGREEARTGLET
jgi:hypothetical protein